MTLRELIQQRGLAGKLCSEILVELNTPTPEFHTTRTSIPKTEVLALLSQGALARIDRAARNDALDVRVQSVCIWLMAVLRSSGFTAIDLGDDPNGTSIADLLAANIVTPSEAEAFQALAQVNDSPAGHHLGRPVTEMQVRQTGLAV